MVVEKSVLPKIPICCHFTPAADDTEAFVLSPGRDRDFSLADSFYGILVKHSISFKLDGIIIR